MGIDWEKMLGTSGNGLNDAYDSTVSAVIYSNDPGRTVGHFQSAKSATKQTANTDLSRRMKTPYFDADADAEDGG
ncbi:hypothetical protein ACIQVK_19500 [Streptomyces sp. NPDC090493]|uniref:hypothetical protein n=1 Tax=Streptomyces sp. NPDC090493 TaxID=3365964 RepID=UPI0037FC8933